MVEILQNKIEVIAGKYADLVDKRLESVLSKSEVDSIAMSEINDVFRILNHAAAALERIGRLHRGNDASVSKND